MMFKKIKIVFVLLVISLILIGGSGYLYYVVIKAPFIEEPFNLYIGKNITDPQIMGEIAEHSKSNRFDIFKMLTSRQKMLEKKKNGAYVFNGDESMIETYRKITRGLQTPVKITFNNIRTNEEFVERISEQLMMDKDSLQKIFDDGVYAKEYGLDQATFSTIFLPDTYEFYWTVSPESFVKRMKKEHDAFWSDSRINKAKSLGVTPLQLATIASIAEEETNDPYERGVVGRLYLNRVSRGMPLQADPTVKYALGDFSIRRVLFEHLKIDSPYNTYKNAGLPPGPIRFASKQTIDAILNSKPHKYLYMCAKEDFSGLHNFATTLTQHNINAAKYRRELNRRKIK